MKKKVDGAKRDARKRKVRGESPTRRPDLPPVPVEPSAAWERLKSKPPKFGKQETLPLTNYKPDTTPGPPLMVWPGLWSTSSCGCKGPWREINGALWWRPVVLCEPHARGIDAACPAGRPWPIEPPIPQGKKRETQKESAPVAQAAKETADDEDDDLPF